MHTDLHTDVYKQLPSSPKGLELEWQNTSREARTQPCLNITILWVTDFLFEMESVNVETHGNI
jgi:hypothetical protein